MSDRARHPGLTEQAVASRLRMRYLREATLLWSCRLAIALALLFLLVLFTDIVRKGWRAFFQTEIAVEVFFDPEVIDPSGKRDPSEWGLVDFTALWRDPLKEEFQPSGRQDRRALYGLFSTGVGFELRDRVLEDPRLIGSTERVWLTASDEVDLIVKGTLDRNVAESDRKVSDQQLVWIDELQSSGRLEQRLSRAFFLHGDSREPEVAGVRAALTGSFYAILVTIAISFPLGVATAVYLEEFAPKENRWIDLIEVNINNLAAVPSIVFGLLGLAVFLNIFGLPRSAPVVGGLVLSLLTLPTIVIAARAAIKAVPPSIRQAAYGLGATPMQVIQHHVLPGAMPGILTGTIIGLARALGETAPLLMIGMVAFIVDVPSSPFDPATALPVQIYLWADSPERAFVAKTSAAIMVLLAFLIVMNTLAVVLRRRWEQRW